MALGILSGRKTTLRDRIALIFTLVTFALLSIVFGIIYYLTYRYTEREFFTRLEDRAVIAARANLEQDELSPPVSEQLRRMHLRTLPEEQEYLVRMDNRDSLAAAPPAFLDMDLILRIEEDGYEEFSYGNRWGVGIRYLDDKGTYAAIVTAVDTYGRRKLNNLGQLMVISLVLYLLIVFLVGRWYAYQILRPISRMISQMRMINTDNLHLRLEEAEENQDELDQLAHTFNNMLDRIETSIEAQNNFIGNASHQLKNPLTAILGEVETALHTEPSLDQYRNSLQTIGQEADRLRILIMQLLRLAHTGDGSEREAFTVWRIDELILELADEYRQMDKKRLLRIDFSGFPADQEHLYLRANRNLIQIALSNLIENAFKFSGDQEVWAAVRVRPPFLIVEIRDQGIGVPPEAIPNIFDPFFRAGNARRFPGYGIGLPLVRKILQMHNGRIQFGSPAEGGTVVTVSLPLPEAS